MLHCGDVRISQNVDFERQYLVLFASAAFADTESSSATSISAQESGIPVAKLVGIVAKKTGKKFVLDPRVLANVIIVGQEANTFSYSDLLTVLHVHGFAAVEDGGYVQVVPDANVRQMPIPTVSERDTRPADEYVSAVIAVKHVPATILVPILLPLLPQHAHLATLPCTNTLIIVDAYSNVRRLEVMIRSLDTGETFKPPSCEVKDGGSQK
jgi:general secretion pathway protein D